LEPVLGFPDNCTYTHYTFITTNESKWVEKTKVIRYWEIGLVPETSVQGTISIVSC
jgi:hypothetical protein